MVLHLRTPILNYFTYLFLAYVLTDSDCGCLTMLAKPYPVSGPTYLPGFPNQLHCMSKGAHEVLWTIFDARRISGFSPKSLFCPYVTEAMHVSLHCVCAAPLCCTCFDFGRIYPDLISLIRCLDLLKFISMWTLF